LSANRYSILFTRRARKDVHRLDKPVISRVSPAIDALVDDPRPPGCIKVKVEEKLWRIRVGDWRIGYEIDDSAREVTVIRVGHRSEFYD
jgi:mRNA interferase RelE/StbE